MNAGKRRILFALCAGVLFGFGLALSGMTNPDKVLNFLDVTGHWDPSLALVLFAALTVATPGYAWARRRGRASCGDALQVPTSTHVDMRLLLGSVLFGIGWGIAGYCPGPALANLAHATTEAFAFVGAVLAGSQLVRLLPSQR